MYPRFQWLTWKERKLGPNFADKPKWTQLRPRLQLWRTEERSKLFSSRPSYILPWPEPTFATDCKNIQNFPHLKTIKSKLLLWNIHIFQLRHKKMQRWCYFGPLSDCTFSPLNILIVEAVSWCWVMERCSDLLCCDLGVRCYWLHPKAHYEARLASHWSIATHPGLLLVNTRTW